MHTRLLAIAFVSWLGVHSNAFAQNPNAEGTPTQDVQDLQRRIDELERRLAPAPAASIDLSGRELATIAHEGGANPLARPWYENFEVSGFGAGRYIDTGGAGADKHGGFDLTAASLYLEVHAWENTSVFADVQLVPFGHDGDERMRTGEIYAHVRELWKNEAGDSIALKAGRFYVPFGEEYTWFRAPDNPLVSVSAPFPYGFDEGVEIYGNRGKLGWIAAITDGADERSGRDGVAKSLNAKVFGQATEDLYLSASVMWNGEHAESAIEVSGSHFDPVGANGASSAGASSSDKVSSLLYEVDARLHVTEDATLSLSLGHAKVEDDDSTFDRSLTWFAIEPRFELSEKLFATLRVSEIGTYDSDEGYHFDGETLAEGNDAFGYDTRRLQRISAGLGWKANPRTVVKLEIGRDRFWVIDGSVFSPADDERDFVGVELVVSF